MEVSECVWLTQDRREFSKKMIAYVTLVATDDLNVPASGFSCEFIQQEHIDAPKQEASQLPAMPTVASGRDTTAPMVQQIGCNKKIKARLRCTAQYHRSGPRFYSDKATAHLT
ncbi:UNVERIFIED_CONTAM: hypothetical protein ACS92_02480 [Bacillus cereus]